MSHVIGALDGKDIRIQCPTKTGTLYYNHKGYFGLVLLAVCDTKYCFSLKLDNMAAANAVERLTVSI